MMWVETWVRLSLVMNPEKRRRSVFEVEKDCPQVRTPWNETHDDTRLETHTCTQSMQTEKQRKKMGMAVTEFVIDSSRWQVPYIGNTTE